MNKTKLKISNILLYIVLSLSAIHLLFLTLSLLNVLPIKHLETIKFNYFMAYILNIICLLLFIGFMFIEKIKKLSIPEWFKIVFYIGFYIFTNVYYFFGFYSSIAGLIIFNIFLAFIFNIIALSVFFNIQKSETNVLKTTTTYTIISTFAYSLAFFAIAETIISAVKLICFKTSIYSSLSMVVIDLCSAILVSVVMALIFSISMMKTKVVINKCLIKYYK